MAVTLCGMHVGAVTLTNACLCTLQAANAERAALAAVESKKEAELAVIEAKREAEVAKIRAAAEAQVHPTTMRCAPHAIACRQLRCCMKKRW